MARYNKPLIWLHGEIKTPPLSRNARIETGFLLRKLQAGESLSMPQSRPMPSVGVRCHELRINDAKSTWRIIYRIDPDAINYHRSLSKENKSDAKKDYQSMPRTVQSL